MTSAASLGNDQNHPNLTAAEIRKSAGETTGALRGTGGGCPADSAPTFSAAKGRDTLIPVRVSELLRLRREVGQMREALSSILTTVEDANQPYERLKIGAIARAGLGEA